MADGNSTAGMVFLLFTQWHLVRSAPRALRISGRPRSAVDQLLSSDLRIDKIAILGAKAVMTTRRPAGPSCSASVLDLPFRN